MERKKKEIKIAVGEHKNENLKKTIDPKKAFYKIQALKMFRAPRPIIKSIETSNGTI
jgi:hypothetical protein